MYSSQGNYDCRNHCIQALVVVFISDKTAATSQPSESQMTWDSHTQSQKKS